MVKQPLSRRDFSRFVAGATLATAPAPAAGALPTRPLGKIGFQASILGLGAQRIADRPMPQSEVDRLVAELIDSGVNYFDTARGYGRSEELLGNALQGRRDQVFLVSKTRAPDRDGAMKDIEESLRLLRTDVLDCVHMHNVGRDDRFPDLAAALSERGALGALREAKRQGKIKHIGCTSHLRPRRTLQVFETGEVEVFMCSMNFVERHIYNYEETVLPEAKRRGIGVIAMKVLGGPTSGGVRPRLSSSQDYEATLRYVWSVPEVAVAIIGMRNLDEVRQAVTAARAYKPFSTTELASLAVRGKALASEWGELRGPVA